MADLSGKRVVPYVVAGLLVAAVGFWGLRHGIAGGAEPPATIVTTAAGAAAARPGGGSSGDGGGVAPGGPAEPETTTTTMLFVQVAGAVARPGVYEVQPGARVFQVVLQAGGMTEEADQDAVPLAAVVVDGGRIWVPRRGEVADPGAAIAQAAAGPAGGSAGAGGGSGAPAAKVVLSTAGEAELDTLPGIGPKTAQQIIAYREEHGPFRSVEELEEVPGIGPATVERLRDLVVP